MLVPPSFTPSLAVTAAGAAGTVGVAHMWGAVGARHMVGAAVVKL